MNNIIVPSAGIKQSFVKQAETEWVIDWLLISYQSAEYNQSRLVLIVMYEIYHNVSRQQVISGIVSKAWYS